jgi:hypothetical protein
MKIYKAREKSSAGTSDPITTKRFIQIFLKIPKLFFKKAASRGVK